MSFCGFDPADHLHARPTANEDTVMKHRDSIIDEIHKLRERIGRAHDFDADRIALTIRQHEREAGRPAVAVALRRTKTAPKRNRRRAAQQRDGAVGA